MISTSDLMKKVSKAQNLNHIKEASNKAVLDAIKGNKRLRGGGKVRTIKDMEAQADELIEIIRSSLPASIRDVGSSITRGPVTMNSNGTFEIQIHFDPSAIRRSSLYEKKYPQGVDNIVALLNNGTDASGSVYGPWAGHEDITGASGGMWKMHEDDDGNVIMKSRPKREALLFIQKSVIEFLTKNKGNVSVVIGSDYTNAHHFKN